MVLFLNTRHPQHPAAPFGDAPEATFDARPWVRFCPLGLSRDALDPSDVETIEIDAVDLGVTSQSDGLHGGG